MQANATEAADAPVVGIEIDCTVVAGRGLVAKDRSLFGKKSSDPYVVISCGKRTLGTTKVVDKSLSPVWNQTFKLNLDAKAAARLESTELVLAVFDKDKMGANDPMGVVRSQCALTLTLPLFPFPSPRPLTRPRYQPLAQTPTL